MAQQMPSGTTGSGGASPGVNGNVLTFVITGSVKGLQAAFTQAQSATKSFSGRMNNEMRILSSGMEKATHVMKEWAAPVAAAATAFYGFSEVMAAFQKGRTLENTAEALGMNVEELQKLEDAATKTGVSQEKFATSLQFMLRFLDQAGEIGGEAQRTISELGLSVKDFDGLNSAEAFGKFSDAVAEIESPSQRAALATKVFGRGVREMMPLLMKGSEAIKKMGEEAEKEGKILSKEDIRQLKEGELAIGELKETVEVLSARIAVNLGPAVKMLSEEFSGAAKETSALASVTKAFGYASAAAIGIVLDAWDLLRAGILAIADVLSFVVGGFVTMGAVIVKTVNWIGDNWKQMWTTAGALVKVVWAELKLAFTTVSSGILVGLSAITKAFGWMGEQAASVIKKLPGMGEYGKSLEETSKSVIEWADTKMKNSGTAIDLAVAEMNDASDELKKSMTGYTSWAATDALGLDKAQDAIGKFEEYVRSEFEKVGSDISHGPEHVTDLVTKLSESYDKAAEKAKTLGEETKKSGEDGSKSLIKLIDAAEMYRRFLEEAPKRHEEFIFGMMKSVQESYEKIQNLAENNAQYNLSLIAQQEAAHEEYLAGRLARENAYHLNLLKMKEQAAEDLADLQGRTEEDWANAQAAYNSNKELEEARSAEQMRLMWEYGVRGKMQVIGSILTDLSVLMESKNRQMFQVGKAAAIANTVLSTYEGAQKAFTSMAGIPVVGPALGAAAAAAAIAAGMVRVQSIQSTQFGSSNVGGAGGGGGGGGSGVSPTQATPQSQVNVSLYGDTFSGKQVRGLIGAISQASDENSNIKIQVGSGYSS